MLEYKKIKELETCLSDIKKAIQIRKRESNRGVHDRNRIGSKPEFQEGFTTISFLHMDLEVEKRNSNDTKEEYDSSRCLRWK